MPMPTNAYQMSISNTKCQMTFVNLHPTRSAEICSMYKQLYQFSVCKTKRRWVNHCSVQANTCVTSKTHSLSEIVLQYNIIYHNYAIRNLHHANKFEHKVLKKYFNALNFESI